MRITQRIRCPNCGNHGSRDYLTNHEVIQTSCEICDYFMVNCSRTGKVIEAYAPGIGLSAFGVLSQAQESLSVTESKLEMTAVAHKQHLLVTHGSSAR